jgi:2-oxoglutarate ferredoxin oxidoreductase subunit delta
MPRHETEYIKLDSGKCNACWKCIESCPNDVIGKVDLPFHKHARIDHSDRCKGCLKCVSVCTAKAITSLRPNIAKC